MIFPWSPSLFGDEWAPASLRLPCSQAVRWPRYGYVGGADRATRGRALERKQGGVEAGGEGWRASDAPVPRYAGEAEGLYLGVGRPPWVHLVHRGRGPETPTSVSVQSRVPFRGLGAFSTGPGQRCLQLVPPHTDDRTGKPRAMSASGRLTTRISP